MRIDRDAALLVGRVLLVMLFLVGGFLKIKYLPGTALYMREAGMPGAGEPLALAAGLIEFAGALAIMAGYRIRLVTAALFVYLLPVTWYAHMSVAHVALEPVVRDNEIFQTLKSLAIMGGLILLYMTGPGSHSLDKRK